MSRLVFFHPDPLWDGLSRLYVELARALRARGVTVAIACPPASPMASAVGDLDVLPFESRAAWVSDTLRFATTLREFKADAVLVSDDAPHRMAAWALRRNGRGIVLRRMRSAVATPITLGTRIAVRIVPTWFMHSSGTEAKAAQPVSGLRGRLVADIAVDPERLERVVPSLAPPGITTVVVVTDGAAHRATAAALRTIAAMRSRGHPLRTLLMGRPHDVSEVRVHATAIGLGDALSIVGDPLDRASLLAGADVVWITADRDDGGVAALDAMALGRPVIATRGTMAERYVADGETGMIAERDDALATAALLTTLQADPAWTARMGEAARDAVRTRRGLADAVDAVMSALGSTARTGI